VSFADHVFTAHSRFFRFMHVIKENKQFIIVAAIKLIRGVGKRCSENRSDMQMVKRWERINEHSVLPKWSWCLVGHGPTATLVPGCSFWQRSECRRGSLLSVFSYYYSPFWLCVGVCACGLGLCNFIQFLEYHFSWLEISCGRCMPSSCQHRVCRLQ
jgi:hypothetical protein